MLNPDDPRISRQAEAAARRFEEEELDRWLHIHSFVYRHGKGFFMVSCLIMLIGMVGLTVTTKGVSSNHHITLLDWSLLLLALVGAQMMGFVQMRPSASSWTSTVVKITGMLVAIAVVITLPGVILLVFL